MDATMERTVFPDPLEQAHLWLRRATCVPYEVRNPGAWLREFQACVSSARRMLAARLADVRHRASDQPRLLNGENKELDNHEQVARLTDELFTEAVTAEAPDLLEMVELTEAAKAIEKTIERLRNHRSDLLFEATYRDLGGAG